MEKQTSDEYTSRLCNYDKLVLGDPNILEITIAGMSNPQLIEFYEYCQEKVEEEADKCELYWYATLFLEEMPVVKMYRDGQLYVDTTLGNVDEPRVLKVVDGIQPEEMESTLTEEDIAQINETLALLDKRKKEKKNPFRKLLKNLRGR